MHNGYSNKEKRKKYLHDLRQRTRPWDTDKFRTYIREYQRKRRGSVPRKPKLPARPKFITGSNAIGKKYELLALNLLRGSLYMNEKSFRGKWDIEWNGKRIDVKMRNKRWGAYSFVRRKDADCDFYLLFCINNSTIEKLLLVPFNEFKNNSLNINSENPLNQYIINLSNSTG